MKAKLSRKQRRENWKGTWPKVNYNGETRAERRRTFRESWDGFCVSGK